MQDDLEGVMEIEHKAVENVVENESHFSLEVVDDGLSSLAMFTKHFMSGFMSGVGEGKDESMGGGSLARCSMVSNDGRGGGGLVVTGERKPRKGQKRIKTGQKREAWQSREKFKAVAVDKGRKTEENAKRMVENAYTVKKLFKL
nr:hypothetical protein [Tanacetum cinerariifolium]